MTYFYCLAFFFVFVLLHNSTRETKYNVYIYYFFACFVALALGLRGNEDEYTRVYVLVPPLGEFLSGDHPVIHGKGIVFSFIASFFKTLTLNSQSIFIFFSGMGVFLHTYFFRKYTKFYFLAFLLYMSHEMCFKEWVGLRMGLASALLLPMVYYLQQGKKIQFFILLAIATLIQYVAILSVFLVFLNKRLSPLLLWAGLIVAIVITKSHIPYNAVWFLQGAGMLPNIVGNYLYAESYVYDAGIMHTKTIQQLITVSVLIILFGYKNEPVSRYYNLLFNAYYLGTLFLVLFSELALFAFRFNGHFYSVEPILITYIIVLYRQKRFVANLISLVALLLAYLNYVFLERVSPYVFLVNDQL